MSGYEYLDEKGTFRLQNPDQTGYLYFPIAGENGVKGAVTPNLCGDLKLDQNAFVLQPVGAEDLAESKAGRNFWCVTDGGVCWSAAGNSAMAEMERFSLLPKEKEDKGNPGCMKEDCSAAVSEENRKRKTDSSDWNCTVLTAGPMWQSVTRRDRRTHLEAEITSFVPVTDELAEMMVVQIRNAGDCPVHFSPIAAVPLYARSADNIRDHRHVTSLLHRIHMTEDGVYVHPTLTFDERGHQRNTKTYFVTGCDGTGAKPIGFCPVLEDFVGEGGSLLWPEKVVRNLPFEEPGQDYAGYESIGALRFADVTLQPGEEAAYLIRIGLSEEMATRCEPRVEWDAHLKNVLHADSAEKKSILQGFETLRVPADEGQEQHEQAGQTKTGIFRSFADVDHAREGQSGWPGTGSIRTLADAKNALQMTKDYWNSRIRVRMKSGDARFDHWMYWVTFQPILRRIYGCSFLPHHDYGKGGRGWRDLWQDCLALLIMNPDGVRQMIIDNCGGVRFDGTNATIIGSCPGEFIADRNNITRVWMDHGFWPLFTVKFYLDQTGDFSVLLKECTYFKDRQEMRGMVIDKDWDLAVNSDEKLNEKSDEKADGKTDKRPNETPKVSGVSGESCGKCRAGHRPILLDRNGKVHTGTVLEHLLVQNMTAFYERGEHDHIRLRDADWNDALDMASERGESVAFTAAYAMNLETLSEILLKLKEKTGMTKLELSQEMEILFTGFETSGQWKPEQEADDQVTDGRDSSSRDSDNQASGGRDLDSQNAEIREPEHQKEAVQKKQAVLRTYCASCYPTVSGRSVFLDTGYAADILQKMADEIRIHIRESEWIQDQEDGWFNSYYDNHGNAVEGIFGEERRMMLTGQVFTIMSGTATDGQTEQVVHAADRLLYEKRLGGYRLNTDFKEVKTDLGRMFGFAYGHKENGAVFSHMAVMFGNALYRRGFVKEGFRALNSLYEQASDFEISRIYPGIPEYFNDRGRGMYHYLTGAASWMLMTVVTQMFGVRGEYGDLLLEPKLQKSQFDAKGRAGLWTDFAHRSWHIVYCNPKGLDYGAYAIKKVWINGSTQGFPEACTSFRLTAEKIGRLGAGAPVSVEVELGT
ncbi:MAG: cellobiose phosphorylase [Lachnospiraceae bacterium]|nr:cellobiose phosphorylase [Lachnospiraceae bacterium]